METAFAFDMGQWVKLRSPLTGQIVGLVIGRIAEECPGGVQRKYVVRTQYRITERDRIVGFSIQNNGVIYHEIELEPYEPEPVTNEPPPFGTSGGMHFTATSP